LIETFGPVPAELVRHVNDDHWTEFMALSQEETDQYSNEHFEQWDKSDFPNLDSQTQNMISRMMKNLDPSKRPSMEEILEDPWWE